MKSQSQYDAIFEFSHIGIVITNSEGTIEEINPFGAALFGYAAVDLIGQKIEILIPKEVQSKHEIHRKSYIKKPTPRSMGLGKDLKAQHKNGNTFLVEISLCSYEIGGEFKVVSFISDITQRKIAENELKELNVELERKVNERTIELSDALVELSHINKDLKKSESQIKESLSQQKELNQMKSRFVSMASHEFRTPLTRILSSANLVEKYIDRDQSENCKNSEKKKKQILNIKKSVKILTSILEEFLSLDQLESGKVHTYFSEFNLKELMDEVILDTEALSVNGQKISFSYEGDEKVFQEREMLRNVLFNLISNAFKYSFSNQKIILKVQVRNKSINIELQDFGVGIPASEQKFLFNRFFRAKNVMNIKGTGLGLNIVKNYVDLMKGQIDVESIEGEGTKVLLSFPMGS